ncbi:MAG: D-alanyl-D-alanine carboxypeptidase family protein [Sulfuriferula sp.]
MAKSLDAWKKSVIGKQIDFDNASYDCVDVSKSWIMYLSDKPWQESAGWGNAKDIYANWYTTYLDKIPRGNAPKLGDILVMNGNVGGGYGHTGVIIAIDGRNVQIAQQNTFTQQAVYTGWFDAYSTSVTGFLRPKIAFSEGTPALQPYQRTVGADGVYYRKTATKAGEAIELFKGGDVVDFKGFVRGESVDGNNVWFVGRYTGFYSWSGGYTDSGTHDLPDLTPSTAPIPTASQRQVGADAMNVRSTPKVDTVNGNVVKLLQPTTIIDVKGWTRGQNVDGIDKWYVLSDGTFTWVGGYTNQDVSNLADLTPKPPVDPTPTDPVPTNPTYPAPTTDSLVTVLVNKKHPSNPLTYAPGDLVSLGNGQQLRREAASAMQLMQQAATAANVALVLGSGYRSYATQETLYNAYVAKDGQAEADRYSARPGYSEHQTGLTMDFSPIDDSFKTSAAYKWLVANASKYGWVLRYPEGKEAVTGYMSEPWHWRYIGVTDAAAFAASGKLTLEEFYGIEGGYYPDPTTPTDPVEPTPDPETPEPPAPTDDAAKSATAFVARVASQLAAAAIIVNGLAGLLNQYASLTFDKSITGIATVVTALAIVAYSQYKYKKTGGSKGWLF